MANDRVYRPAGLLENFHIARGNLELDSCVVVAARFVLTSSSSLEERVQTRKLAKEKVYAAVVHTLRTHAALSVRVVLSNISTGKKIGAGKNGKDTRNEAYVFERLETVNIEKCVRFLDNSDASTGEDIAVLIQNEFTQPIPSVYSTPDSKKDALESDFEPLWRLTVTPHNTLIFAWHHCIGDAQSGLAVLRSLLEGLNNPLPSLEADLDFDPRAVKTPTGLKLTPALEELTDLSVSLKTLLAAVVGLVIPDSWKRSAKKTWTGHPVLSTPNTFTTRTRLVSISPERVARILESARKHKSTLTPVLYFLVVNVLSKLISKDTKNGGYTRVSINVPVSLRPLAKVPNTVMGELISVHRSTAPLLLRERSTSSEEVDWTTAANFSRKLQISIPKTREVMGLLKYLNGQYEPFFRKKLEKKREMTLEISNVGAFKPQPQLHPDTGTNARIDSEKELNASDVKHEEGKENGGWSIADTYFAQDDGIVGSALKMSVVGSPSGSVNVCVTWGEGAIDDGFAEAFVKELGAPLEKLTVELHKGEESG